MDRIRRRRPTENQSAESQRALPPKLKSLPANMPWSTATGSMGPSASPPGMVRHGAEILADGEERAVPEDESETSDVCLGLSPVYAEPTHDVVPADAGGAAEVRR